MKKMMKKILAVAMAAAVLMSSAVSVGAEEDKVGTGKYTIIVHNDNDTGISIDGDTFHAYQIFSASDVSSYAVTDNFKDFFVGVKVGGDGNEYDFNAQLDIMNDSASESHEIDAAETQYNHLAGLYMDSYRSNMYTLAEAIRDYLDANGAYNPENADGIECNAHAEAVMNNDGSQTATLAGLTTGYYFIMDQECEIAGLGVAASGSFVPVAHDGDKVITIKVKDSVPTVTKQIYHNDQSKWDVVGDHQIGDTVEFLVTSTLPSNVEEYDSYTYVLTDVMSKGITYNDNVKLYTDFVRTNEVGSEYLTISNQPETGEAFVVEVNVKAFMEANPDVTTLYTYYTGVLNYSAAVASEHDNNTITLEYSNNPNDLDQTGTSASTVFHYTFALNVEKVDEKLAGLAGARFGLFDDDGNAIKLAKGDVDMTTGVVNYFPSDEVEEILDGGYITTETVALTDGTTVTGLFRIYGMDDAETYILREVEAPEGYNAVDDISFKFTASYNATGTGLVSLTDGSPLIHTENFESSTAIMNLKTVFLPSTGGMGTTLFQIGGGALMLGGALFLLMSRRKKED